MSFAMVKGRSARTAWLVAVSLAALRLTWTTVAFIFGFGDVRRHHVESSAFIFVALLAVSALWFSRRPSKRAAESESITRTSAALIVILGVWLYYPALGIGLLSDDFVLLRWATAFDLMPDTWDYIRPFPLAVWWAVSRLVPQPIVPLALHFVDVALHVVNALLVMKLALRLGLDKDRSVLSALLFVAFPLSVEAVAWTSAVFDQMLVTLVLLNVIVVLTSSVMTSAIVAVVALTTLALCN